MEMTLRWYGEGYDSVTLNQIRQIPGVTGVISTLYGTQPGEEWKDEEIKKIKIPGGKLQGFICPELKV